MRGRTRQPIRSRGPCAIVLLAAIALLGLAACESSTAPASTALGNDWKQFQGTWTAVGNRQVLRLGGDRRASIAQFDGSLVLAGPLRPAIGFRAEAVVFNDSATGMLGRAVWTDERGDHVYSELRGEGTATGNHVIGTFQGGTGRYAGATGTYEFSWRFLLEAEDGSVQGQSTDLRGQARIGTPLAAPATEGTRP